ncbi:hypothetical protein KQY27_03240 [Methanobrevibacter sp. TMH8]|uniref:hypothetical protein n=1 Tax=Methanobrevibacter sp. TMH8 TaxID=2848611 RepID=UPI001CCEE7F6|nr:hypothetical protein [Methanobrevibacter sp. TMH8]MBZ9570559.1 hypothetical protein [Methanobrevibacter sp. TMH8]
MNKFWIVPIITFLVLSIGLFGSLLSSTNINTNEQIIINGASFQESNMGFGTSYLNLNINATFLEDIESITINGVLHKKDGTYTNINFNGKPNNGLKNNNYLLEYSSTFMMDSEDIKNMDYLELTIKTTNNKGHNKEIKVNITSNGQVTTNQDNTKLNSQNQSNILNSNSTEDNKDSNSENPSSGSNSVDFVFPTNKKLPNIDTNLHDRSKDYNEEDNERETVTVTRK